MSFEFTWNGKEYNCNPLDEIPIDGEDKGKQLYTVIGMPKEVAEYIYNSFLYKAKRISEYPPIEDYLDGVVKGDQEQINEYIAKCIAVKQKYPKP